MGVTFDKSRNKYRASIQLNGKTKHIGRYDTKLKATRALNKYRRDNAAKPVNHINVENVGSRGQIVPVRVEEKPSLWHKIKSIWRSIKQRN